MKIEEETLTRTIRREVQNAGSEEDRRRGESGGKEGGEGNMGGLEKEGGKKRGGSDGHFSTLRAPRFSESSPFKLVYLTFV